jgi:hypothetical protein
MYMAAAGAATPVASSLLEGEGNASDCLIKRQKTMNSDLMTALGGV